MTDGRRRLISVVVPVLNEEHNIRALYGALLPIFDALSDRYGSELIFTDNHSTDRTFELAAEIAERDRRVRVFRFSRNFGFQNSILTGYQKARGDAVVQIDCDLQDPPALILEFVRKWEAGFQVVYGIRKKRKEGLLINWLRSVFYHLVNWLSEYPLPQQAGDFRLIARPIVEELKKMDEPYPYIRGMIAGMGFNQTGIPYDRQERKHDESKFNLTRLIALAVDGILNTSVVPLRVATFTGIAVFLLTSLGVLYYLVAGLLYGREKWPSGFATVIIAVLLSLGLNAFFLGIIGEYLGRVYNQVKKRPTVIMEQCIDSDGYMDLRDFQSAANGEGEPLTRSRGSSSPG
jgi:polyisoprenyl-phosphate glycosyltransferase